MRRDLTIKTCTLQGTSDLTVIAPIRKGLIPSLDAITYKTRVKRVLRALHLARTTAHESELARIMSDAVERVGKIHSVRIAVLEPDDKVLLAVTFDGDWESYVRVIWQKVARLLDLIFCNTEDYVLGWENSFAAWGAWLRSSQAETSFLYSHPGLTTDDVQYLRMGERLQRRSADEGVDVNVTRIMIPSPEEIAVSSYREGVDPTNLGFSVPLPLEDAGRPAFRQGLRGLVGLYRLADVFLRGTDDGKVLHRAAQELLPEFRRMVVDEGETYQFGIKRARRRFDEALQWFMNPIETLPEVREPLPLPEEPPSIDVEDVQGGILHAYPGVEHGCLLLLRCETPAALAQFLGTVPTTTAADSLELNAIATNLAFTIEGLRYAGLTEPEINAFPEAFVQGMERRAGVLGDVRVNHPRRWRLPVANWGDGIDATDPSDITDLARIDLSSVHLVVQVRLRSRNEDASVSRSEARQRLLDHLRAMLDDIDGATPLSLQWMQRHFDDKGETREHFGFTDGRSQPVLRGNEAGVRFSNQVHLGEMLRGYPNAADISADDGEAAPLLHNGTFLVVRKLRQDVPALELVLAEAVETQKKAEVAHAALSRAELLAKMMGRWPIGHPNAGEPLAKVGKTPNDFNFDKDPQGSLCPFHAHMRRANPRFTQPASGSRPPRLVRRSMSYGPLFDPDAKQAEPQERGLVFMAYNADIGEQFEVVQRWLSGGNSSGSYSGQSDPFLGVAEAGRQRHFRFEHDGHTVRMPLDGSDLMHAEPRPLVRLEWGMYLFTPSLTALRMLEERAAAAGDRVATLWSIDAGEREIGRLREVERQEGAVAAAMAWKAVLEDPDAATDFTAASVWAAIRERHDGVLRTPFGILVASTQRVQEMLLDENRRLTAAGYMPRMQRSFGGIYLGLDSGQQDRRYEIESEDCNRAIRDLDPQQTYMKANEATLAALLELIDEAVDHARADSESRWELTFDVRELVDKVLAVFCEAWFGLSTEGGCFRRGGYRWDWKDGAPYYPGNFIAPSRYFFQPHPGPEVEALGAEHGLALRDAMLKFLDLFRESIDAPVTRAVLDSELGNDPAFVARTVVGAVMGFVPTVDGNLRRICNEWLRDGTLWSLRAKYAGLAANDFAEAKERLGAAIVRAMQLRTAPELLWRTAVVSHTIGETEAHRVTVAPGEIVIASLISATQDTLEHSDLDLSVAFGGDRFVMPHPTHACPGYRAAMAVLVGFFSALVETSEALRAGPAPLTLSLDGPVPDYDRDARDERERDIVDIWQRGRIASTVVPLLTLGDSWLSEYPLFDSLLSALRERGYGAERGARFGSAGQLLAKLAASDVRAVVRFLQNLDDDDGDPRAILIGGGGNDVVYPSSAPAATRLYRVLRDDATNAEDALIESEVKQFIDVELFGHYKTIVDLLKPVTKLPILIHAYDHPIPDGRPAPFAGPWLKAVFDKRRISDPKVARKVMQILIDRLDAVVERIALANTGFVHHVKLCGTLADDPDFAKDYTLFWGNELHATERGFGLLADVFVNKLEDLGISRRE